MPGSVRMRLASVLLGAVFFVIGAASLPRRQFTAPAAAAAPWTAVAAAQAPASPYAEASFAAAGAPLILRGADSGTAPGGRSFAFALLGLAVGLVSARGSTALASVGGWSGDGGGSWGNSGSSQEVEYIIYPDGRVEQSVNGVKGKQCLELTEKIEEALGEVVSQTPTAEMFEQEVVVQVEETQEVKDERGW